MCSHVWYGTQRLVDPAAKHWQRDREALASAASDPRGSAASDPTVTSTLVQLTTTLVELTRFCSLRQLHCDQRSHR